MDATSASAAQDPSLKLPAVNVVETDGVERRSEEAQEPDTDALSSGSESSDDELGEEWETESLYEDALQVLDDEDLRVGGRDTFCLMLGCFAQ